MSENMNKQPNHTSMPEISDQKRPRRLLVQVGLIFGIFFALIILITSILVVKGNMSTYLEAKEELLTPILTRARQRLNEIPEYDWYLDFWEAHPDKIHTSLTKEEYEILEKYHINTDSIENLPDRKTLDSLNLETQAILASEVYYDFSAQMNLAQWQLNNENLFCIDVSEKDPGFIFVVGRMNDQNLNSIDFGALFQSVGNHMDVSGLSSITKLQKGSYNKDSRDVLFERYERPKDGAFFYYGFAPILVNGKSRCAIIIAHNWSDFHSQMMFQLAIMTIASALVIFIAGAFLLVYINRAAIRPLRKIQLGVQNYIQSKDSTSAIEEMGHIRQKNEFGALARNFSDLAIEIDRYTNENTALTAERERVSTELSLATAIQAGALPTDFPTEPDYRLYATMTPAKEVGGDFYDFFNIDDTHIGLVLGDVSGKGVPAALYMMMAQLLIRQYAKSGCSAAETLTETNKVLCENNKLEMFVTAWFGILDRTTGKITASSAGHEFPIVRKAILPPDPKTAKNAANDSSVNASVNTSTDSASSGTTETSDNFTLFKDRHGFVLGGMDTSKYKEYEFTLMPGGTFFIYSDGAPEATSAAEELFGTNCMLEVLNRTPDEDPRELTDALQSAINEFVGEAPKFDDLTMLCIKYTG